MIEYLKAGRGKSEDKNCDRNRRSTRGLEAQSEVHDATELELQDKARILAKPELVRTGQEAMVARREPGGGRHERHGGRPRRRG